MPHIRLSDMRDAFTKISLFSLLLLYYFWLETPFESQKLSRAPYPA